MLYSHSQIASKLLSEINYDDLITFIPVVADEVEKLLVKPAK